MQYAPVNSGSYVPPPLPKLNGGLYTGEPFKEGAPWATVPVVPDIDYMIHYNLRSANPPIQALFQYPGTNRPGNNYQAMSGLAQSKEYNFTCTPCLSKKCFDTKGQEVKCGEKQ